MKAPQKAIILAAGMATRMLPLSLDTPKPILPLWGKPVIGHILNLLRRWKVKEVLINLHFNASPLCEYFKSEKPSNLKIAFSFEPEILGTGGVLRRARWFLDSEPFWMINSDIAADLAPDRLISEFKRNNTIAALWMEPDRGALTVEMQRGNILDFHTSRPGTKGTYTFCGLQLISLELLRYLPQDSFCSIIQAYINAINNSRKVRGVCVPGSYWADLGTPESYLKTHSEIRERYYRKLPGRELYNPGLARWATLLRKKGVSISGFAAIDKTAVIHPGARIENAVVWHNAVIGPKAIVQNAIVGSECEVNERVQRLAVKPSFNGQFTDIQLNLAMERLKLDRFNSIIMPFAPRGSARSFTRITGRGKNYIMIRYSRERHENCLYARHAVFLKKIGLNVPFVIADFTKQKFTLIQDLGDQALQQIAGKSSRAKLIRLYHQVLKAVVVLHAKGARAAQKDHLEMVAAFSPDLYRWEREFFTRFFLTPYLKIKPPIIRRIMTELAQIGKTLQRKRQVLIHRDLQSSNIMFYKHKPYFIDFQGMRFGPAAYDLASLLCDPYIRLSLKEQNVLLDYYNFIAGEKARITPGIFWLAGIQRLSQALGAYGRLSANPETARFKRYIPPALKMMRRALEQAGTCPRLYTNILAAESLSWLS